MQILHQMRHMLIFYVFVNLLYVYFFFSMTQPLQHSRRHLMCIMDYSPHMLPATYSNFIRITMGDANFQHTHTCTQVHLSPTFLEHLYSFLFMQLDNLPLSGRCVSVFHFVFFFILFCLNFKDDCLCKSQEISSTNKHIRHWGHIFCILM